MLKADLHLHTAEDPLDLVSYSAEQLLDRAYGLSFDVLAVTLHGEVFYDPALIERAASIGILLIPGVEMRLDGADVVVLNVTPTDVAKVKSFGDLRVLRRRRGADILTIAPHPFYVLGGSIGNAIHQVMDCIDVVEMCRFHTKLLNPNRKGIAVAEQYKRPMVATSDAHQLEVFGRAYTEIDAPTPATAGEVFDAIRANRVELHSPSLSIGDFFADLFHIMVDHPMRRFLNERAIAKAGKSRENAD